jgi:hypothetical protein
MTENAHDPFRNRSNARPATKLEWDDGHETAQSTVPKTTGDFKTPTARLAIRLEWADSALSHGAKLELVVRPDPNANAVDLAFGLIDLLASVNAVDRWLGGNGLTKVAGSQTNGSLSITLTAIGQPTCADRIQQICDECNRASAENPRLMLPKSVASLEARIG